MVKSCSLALTALLLCLAATPSWAAPNATQTLDAWQEHPDLEAVRALALDHGLLLESSKHWHAGEPGEVLAGARALPPFMMARFKREPIRVVRRAKACLHGLGRYSRSCPTFSRDGKTFFLYNVPPPQGEGAARRLKVLTAAELPALMRRRAVAHLATALMDQQMKWSASTQWRAINGWNRSGRKAFNLDVWGYSRYQGMDSAHMDLVTFAEEFFARPQDILRDSSDPEVRSRLNTLDWDLTLACQQFTKIRIFSKILAQHDAAWTPPKRGPREARPLGECTQFQMWSDMQNVEGVDLLLAAATSDRPESLYGHLLMGVRYKQGKSLRSRGFEPVYQYGAITDTNVTKVEYFSKGLLGGFYSIIQPNTFRGVDRLFMQYEQRTLRRYGLNLTDEQVLHVMQRLWEAERHITFPYYFLSDNCASMLIDLLAPALDDIEVPNPFRLALMPTEVLDLLASAQNGELGPLLYKRPETHFSSREVAMDAVPRRRAALSELLDAIGERATPEQRSRLTSLDMSLDDRDPVVRKKAYATLKETLLTTLAGLKLEDPERVNLHAINYLYYSSRIERYFMDVAFYARRLIYASALKDPPQFTAEEQLLMRRELYMSEDLEERQKALLALARLGDQRLRTGARRDLTESEEADLAQIALTQEAYLASLDTLATIIETFEPNLDGVAFIEEKSAAFEAEQQAHDQRSIGPPGKGRFILGGSGGALAGAQDTTGFRGGVELSASIVHERLGEQRRRGFRSDIASRAVGLDLEGVVDEDFVRRLKADLTLFEFMSIEQRMGPVRESWRDLFGWGLGVRVHHDGRRGLDVAPHGEVGYVYPIWVSDRVSNFLVFGGYAALRRDWGQQSNASLAGVKGLLMGQLHLYGSYANVMRMEVETYQYAHLTRLAHSWDVRARLQTEHVLGELNQQVLMLQPYVQYERSTLSYLPQGEPFGHARAGLRVELPF